MVLVRGGDHPEGVALRPLRETEAHSGGERLREERLDPRAPVGGERERFGRRRATLADGATVSTQELLRRGWDEYTGSFSNVVKVTISRLRRKLGEPPVIETVSHAGYRI